MRCRCWASPPPPPAEYDDGDDMPTMKLLLLGDDGANAKDEWRLPRARDSRTKSREGDDAMVTVTNSQENVSLNIWYVPINVGQRCTIPKYVEVPEYLP